MTRTLKLMVHGDMKAQGAPVVAFARPLSGGAEQRIPARIGATAEVPLDAGRWMVEVVLPSGERLREVVDLTDDRVAAVAVGLSRGPHEWLGFQQLLVPPGRLGGDVGVDRRDALGPKPVAVYAFPDWRSLCEDVRRAARTGTPLDLTDARPLAPRNDDGRLSLFELEPRRWSAPTRPVAPDAFVAGVVVRIGPRVLVLPVAREWHDAEGGERQTELVVDAAAGTVSAAIEDPRFALLLGYLAGGRSDLAADALGEIPQDLLYSKYANPLAAAAGAYILIDQLHDATRRPVWRPWIDNLAASFRRVPDGAILAGRARLHEDDPAGACAHFVDAAERGIPFFAAGVRMLLAGLLSFRDSDVPAPLQGRFGQARDEVRRWTTWLVPRDPFATLDPDLAL